MKRSSWLLVSIMMLMPLLTGCTGGEPGTIHLPGLDIHFPSSPPEIDFTLPEVIVDFAERDTIVGSKVFIEEKRELEPFNEIDMQSMGEVFIQFGEKESLRIETEHNLLEYIETEVVDDKLEIRSKPDVRFKPTRTIRFYVTVRELHSVIVSGLGDVTVPFIEVDHFRAYVSGAGNLKIEGVNADQLGVTISGLGDVEIQAGQVREQVVVVSGSGSYSAKNLQSRNCAVTITGIGEVIVWVLDALAANISGAGDVKYYGSPKTLPLISGVGALIQLSR
jgi:hypothetical protein